MIRLVTIKQAERHLRLDIDNTNTEHVPDLELKLDAATEIILNYLKIPIPEHTSPIEDSPTYDYWANNPNAVPFGIKAAALLAVAELWENREASVADVLSPAVCSLLARYRTAAMA